MTPEGMRAALAEMGLSQNGLARLMGVNARTARRWALGQTPVPERVSVFLTVARLLRDGEFSRAADACAAAARS